MGAKKIAFDFRESPNLRFWGHRGAPTNTSGYTTTDLVKRDELIDLHGLESARAERGLVLGELQLRDEHSERLCFL